SVWPRLWWTVSWRMLLRSAKLARRIQQFKDNVRRLATVTRDVSKDRAVLVFSEPEAFPYRSSAVAPKGPLAFHLLKPAAFIEQRSSAISILSSELLA